jgi:hypothetical protein
MNWFLLVIPTALISSILMYRFVGRREFFRFDLVQFFYAFILTPLIFLWGKILLFLLLKNGQSAGSSDVTYLLFDSVFSLIFLYIFGFELLHSLTKSVNLKIKSDPLYDIFNYLEYFHLWLTHLVIFGGGLLMISIFTLTNLFFPLEITLTPYLFYSLLGLGFLTGGLLFMGIWLSDPHQEKGYHFMRVMKILIGVLFILHMLGYLAITPGLNAHYVLFWWGALNFTMMVSAAFFSYKSTRAKKWFERFSNKLKHPGWEFRTQIQSESTSAGYRK